MPTFVIKVHDESWSRATIQQYSSPIVAAHGEGESTVKILC